MATLTSTSIANSDPAKSVPQGELSKSVSYNSDSTAISASATTVLMLSVPDDARITEVIGYHSSGAASCPADIGIQGVDLSLFASAQTQGATFRMTKQAFYDVTSTTSAVQNGSRILTYTVTPGTATGSVKMELTVKYTMDKT
jgi:hypothetical protein